MKIFISADIEGVTGVTDWRETRYGGQGYEQACEQMSLEVMRLLLKTDMKMH